jgi:hypothetical protein
MRTGDLTFLEAVMGGRWEVLLGQRLLITIAFLKLWLSVEDLVFPHKRAFMHTIDQ